MTDTPCIQICVLDPHSGLCRGCGRTGAEIAAWPTLDRASRRAVMAELPSRIRSADWASALGGDHGA
ncbi:MAG: DUF1289 domain-containing protein [Fulvimarina manganoxydans]|uniref:DUF1289 domain-containing protein n=1 Tax=Fulvimarina manganoxydans TaxID=937218 RepID=UPI002356DEB3|nr:DUF1289 domain-containing protein [Fulvimarina manganoxydans]MCK5932126.1 DUF1289 domain-containing protein [Fulvimarina manganoxydans]